MSGTSLDGEIDVALIETDGTAYLKPLGFYAHAYDPALRELISQCFGKRASDDDTSRAEEIVTNIHIEAVKASGFQGDVIGFHGQTITHDPAAGFTWQLGDGQWLARETGMDVVYDFRTADIKAGGQGAPLLPVYHQALVRQAEIKHPCAVLNIGGVANVTWIGPEDNDLMGFDTGPGNALMDDFVRARTGQAFDKDGALARAGTADMELVEEWLSHEYFMIAPPKSLDRNEWDIAAMGPFVEQLQDLSTEDGLASLLEFTAAAVLKALGHMPEPPAYWMACGGGAHNTALMERLAREITFKPIAHIGAREDSMEAEGFAYFAVRHLLGEPITFPHTTGVSKPVVCGTFAPL